MAAAASTNPKRSADIAKLKSNLSSETLMNWGFAIIFLNIIFGLLPVTLHKTYISHSCISASKIYTTYLIFAMCAASVYFVPITFQAFFARSEVSLTDIIAVAIVRTSHVIGYIALLMRAHWVAKRLPSAWKLLTKAVQHGILEIHGKNWRKWKKLRWFTIWSIFVYLCLMVATEVLFIKSEMFGWIAYLARTEILSETHGTPKGVQLLMWGYLIWDVASLSHVLVSILLNFLILVVILCLKSVNQLLKKVVMEYVQKEPHAHTEAEDKLLLYRLNHVKQVYSILEDFVKNLNVTFGITIVVEVLILIGNTLINLYFIISELMAGKSTEHMFDSGQFVVSTIAHFYFLYRLACACSDMMNESKRPLRILRDIKYSLGTTNQKLGVNNQIHQFLTDMGNSSIVLSAAEYFVVNKFLITSLVGSITTYLIVLIQFKQQEQSGGGSNPVPTSPPELTPTPISPTPTPAPDDYNNYPSM